MRTNNTHSGITDKIFIELDCLLDTRIGILNYVNSDTAKQVASSGHYHTRLRDVFSDIIPNFDDDSFLNTYKHRTIDNLQGNVIPTNMFFRIKSFIKECRNLHEGSPDPQEVSVSVNTFPYQLTEVESTVMTETLREGLFCDNITLVSTPIHFLTPGTIKTNYTQVIMYDFDTWVNMHINELKKCPMPSIQFLAPAIANNGIEEEKAIRSGLPAQAARYAFGGFIELNLTPLKDFSFDIDSSFF